MIREPMTPKNVIDLDGPDGNAFALMALVEGLAREYVYVNVFSLRKGVQAYVTLSYYYESRQARVLWRGSVIVNYRRVAYFVHAYGGGVFIQKTQEKFPILHLLCVSSIAVNK